MEYTEKQLEAIEKCTNVSNRLVAITGKGGTGKTTLIKKIYEDLTKLGLLVALTAPTGKAAKRIEEATGIKAFTNHKLLGYGKPDDENATIQIFNKTKPRYGINNKLDYDVILCDEYAMVNTEIHNNLQAAIKNTGCMRFFGDVNQLPPIEEDKLSDKRNAIKKSPFKVMLENKNIPSVVLDINKRIGDNTGLKDNLDKILKGMLPTSNTNWNTVYTNNPIQVLDDVVIKAEEAGVLYNTLDNQIITIQRTTWIGTLQLNERLQKYYNKKHGFSKPSIEVTSIKGDKEETQLFYVGDKVIHTVNNYDLDVMNGSTGIIKEINQLEQTITVEFEDQIVEYPTQLSYTTINGYVKYYDPRTQLQLAYVLTTHKTQGSEYKNVIYILNKTVVYMANRENLYTGCSRAKNYVNLITDTQTIQSALKKVIG